MENTKNYIFVAINGLGRIGRLLFRHILVHPRIVVVAINDRMDHENLKYLLEHDTAHRELVWQMVKHEKKLIVGKHMIKFLSEKKISRLPWKKLKIDVVIDATGTVKTHKDAMAHIEAGAKHVITTNTMEDKVKTIVYGVNHDQITVNDQILSASSCTTNALALVLNVIQKHDQIIKGFFNTVHAPTSDQKALDQPHETDWRRGRSILNNIIPTSSYAEKGIEQIFPQLKHKIKGSSVRVPVLTGSLIDVVIETQSEWNTPTIQQWFQKNQIEKVLKTETNLTVSSDIIGNKFGAIVDNNLIRANHNLIRLGVWYDNESSYVHQVSRTLDCLAKLILKLHNHQ